MFGAVAYKIFGSSNDRLLKKIKKPIPEINSFDEQMVSLSDDELKAQTDKLRNLIKDGQTLDDILPEAFATVREASKRTLGLRHFDVQMMGGVVLHQGHIAEMSTGEGKTLVATLAAYLNALEGKGVHVVTVNDYLAKRDADWMRPIFEFMGLTVGYIIDNISDSERRNAYACDVTYGTNNEFGFDYLRDNMKFDLAEMVQRPFNFAIVDEVDSILIDEARTPLIISGSIEDSTEMYNSIDKLIPLLKEEDYDIDEKLKNIVLTDKGNQHAEDILSEAGILTDGNLYDAQNITLVHHINQGLRAHKLFTNDKDYIVKDNQVIIIDEFTGRMMEGRRFSEGLHQALEARENVQVQNENQILASITFQNYFRLYPKLSGMTGTAMTEAGEFEEIYGLRVIDMPTNVVRQRLDNHDEIYRTEEEKHDAIVALVQDCYDHKQPVLVGTTSIDKSETLSKVLKKNKIPHKVLNAKFHEQEAYIISQAGMPGAITIATNMAGRGTDIKLGGNLDMMIEEKFGTSATDKQIKELEEEFKKNQELVKEQGGLYIVGTERHESRRIDNQLRGRSGRQGDPGASKFFLSLEDDLMRIFGSEKMDVFLQKMGLKKGQPIIHPWINKALERAQKKVEGQHFEIRKNLLKFDDVMNEQRKVMYDQRKEIMSSDDLSDIVKDMRHDTIEDLVSKTIPPNAYADKWDVETLQIEALRVLNIDIPVKEWAKEEGVADREILERITDISDKKMAEKATNLSPAIMRQIEKTILLQLLDTIWKEHLLNLEHLRQGITLRAFGQKDPLNEYKSESFGMFEIMLDDLRERVTLALSIINIDAETEAPDMPRLKDQKTVNSHRSFNELQAGESFIQPAFDPENPDTWGKVPRNAACPCNSGMKFKHCHGKAA